MKIMQELENKNKKLLYKTLGMIIKKYRKEQQKSVYELAAVSSMSTNSWNRVEKYTSLDPSFTTIWKIAEALDIQPHELIKEVYDKLGDDFSLSGII